MSDIVGGLKILTEAFKRMKEKIIYLPLLYADGQPTSLDKISQVQLERFIPFMVSCLPDVNTGTAPKWWVSTVPFPLIPKQIPSQIWVQSLREIVCRCYQYYGCEHMLRFCARLSEIPPRNLKYKEFNGFISIYNKSNDKLLVTFNKKIQIYDKPVSSPCKNLLPRKPCQLPNNNIIEDIYLCPYCDDEFSKAKDVEAHEAVCKEKVDEEEKKRNAVINQVDLLRYFELMPKNASKQNSMKRGTSIKLAARKYAQVPISSPLGLKMASNIQSLKFNVKQDNIWRNESHCRLMGPCQSRKSRGYRSCWKKKNEVWTHTYAFNKSQRREKQMTLATGLNKRSRRLLNNCKPAVVLVEKLPILDPLAVYAAARLNLSPEMNQQSARKDFVLTCEEINMKENRGTEEQRNNQDIFFPKRPPLTVLLGPDAISSSTFPSSARSSQSLFLPIASF